MMKGNGETSQGIRLALLFSALSSIPILHTWHVMTLGLIWSCSYYAVCITKIVRIIIFRRSSIVFKLLVVSCAGGSSVGRLE